MKRDAVILLIATCVMAVLAYNGRYTEKADILAIQDVAETESVEVRTYVMETEAIASEPMDEEKTIISSEIATDGFIMYSSIWDKVHMTFYKDGTCVFEMPSFQVVEPCTWVYEDGILRVTREDGVVFTSYIDEDRTTLKLDYVALVSDQLVGQLDSLDYKCFFEAE